MHRLQRHPYYVFVRGGRLYLCSIKNDGPEWFAGDFNCQEVTHPVNPELLRDIAEVLGKSLEDVAALAVFPSNERAIHK